jgi:anti-sigma factor RsiW
VREQHLSDEAIAACADDVLPGLARGRALRHVESCAECAYAVAGQREAAYVLRAAPAPLLPFGLLDRLRDVPTTTPLTTVPGSIAPDGTAMFATFGSMHFTMSPTAFVEPVRPAAQRNRHVLPMMATAAAVMAAGIVAVGSGTPALSTAHSSTRHGQPTPVLDQQFGPQDADRLAAVTTPWMR